MHKVLKEKSVFSRTILLVWTLTSMFKHSGDFCAWPHGLVSCPLFPSCPILHTYQSNEEYSLPISGSLSLSVESPNQSLNSDNWFLKSKNQKEAIKDNYVGIYMCVCVYVCVYIYIKKCVCHIYISTHIYHIHIWKICKYQKKEASLKLPKLFKAPPPLRQRVL